MKETYEKMGTIRGTRYAIKLTKDVKGMPGFAPDYSERDVCDVVFKFPHGEGTPYVQFSENPPILELTDINQIKKLLESENEFDESKYSFPEPL
jgi:hypothetical protein